MWQSLVRNLIYGAARRRMSEAAQAAAAGEGRPETAAKPVPPGRRPACHVGLVFALGIESTSFVDRMAGVIRISGAGFVGREGGLHGRRVVAIEAGVGRRAAERGTHALIAGHKPQWVISAGFAGGLDQRLRMGDIVIADRVADLAGRELEIDVNVDAAIQAANPRLHVGRLITVDHIIHDAKQKERLGRERQAIAVDMESMAVAEVCRQEKVPFMAVRVISDPVMRDLPRDIDYLVKRRSTAGRLGAAARAILHRPSSVKDMWQLREDALRASQQLGGFLVGVVKQLERERDEGREARSEEKTRND